MDFRVRLLFISAMGSVFFLVGYLYGEMWVGGPSSVELHSMNLNFHEVLKPSARDLFIMAADLDSLEKEVVAAQEWAAATHLTLDLLPKHQGSARRLRQLSEQVLEAARLSLADPRYERARDVLQGIQESIGLAHDRLEAILPAAVGLRANWSASGTAGEGELVIQVAERPFGAHVRRGSTRVAEVFPGFPAQRLGVRPGCEITHIAGQPVFAGNWMETFQKAQLPFELRLRCQPFESTQTGKGPISSDPHNFRVMVVRKPFGMNIQVHVTPRVIEVLPGFPAEAAGVREGYVLKEVNDRPVDAVTWFEAFQTTPLPFTLTFDTTVPLHAGNPFFADSRTKPPSEGSTSHAKHLLFPPDTEYTDFRCEVTSLPFGMQIRAPLDGWPQVSQVLRRHPAEQQGVRVGDILVGVAGLPVNSSTWFAAFQHSAPPFGLLFRRPSRV